MLQRLFSVLDFVKAGLVNAGLVNQNLANGQFFRYGSAVFIVLALSLAEIPVATPFFASIETVKAV